MNVITPLRLRDEAMHLLRLAAPVIGTQLGMMTLGVVDTVMVGHLGVKAIGAAALGNVWVMGTLIAGMGLVLGIDPLVSQGHGARDAKKMGHALQQGLAIAALSSVPIALLWLFTGPILIGLRQDPEIAWAAHRYALVQLPGIPAFLGFIAFRAYLMNRGLMWPALWVVLAANLLNAGLNYILIFGKLGLPAWGVTGAGLATGITRVFLFAALAVWIIRFQLHRDAWTGWSRHAVAWSQLRHTVALGAPIGIQFGLEIWAFQIATLLSGWLGAAELAAGTIVLNLASVSFMVPLGVAIGTAARVGNLIGAGHSRAAQRSAWVALGLGALFMSFFAMLFVVFRRTLPALYTSDATTIALAAGALPIAAAFQLFDGTQVVGGAILRGMGKTRPAALFNLLGYYAIALPLGAWLAFRAGWGLRGLWCGLAAGLMVVATALVIWIWRRGPAHVPTS